MFCEKCGTYNEDHAILCAKCGEPLNIEKNVITDENKKIKGPHVDIDDISQKNNRDTYLATKKVVFRIILVILIFTFFGILFLGYQIAMNYKSKDIMNKYHELLKSDEKSLIYLGNNNDYNEQLEKYANNYEFQYLYMQTDKLTGYTKNKIRKTLNISSTDSIIVLIENKEIKDSKSISSNEELGEFLILHKLVSEMNEETKIIKDLFQDSITSEEASVIYIPSILNDNTERQNQMLTELCEEYNLNYINIHGYALNENQLLKIYNQLGYSEIKSQLILFVQNSEIKTIIEDIKNTKEEYLSNLKNYGIIENNNQKELISIDEQQFIDMIDSKSNYIILIDKENSKFIERIINILKDIINTNEIDIYYLQVSGNEISISDILKDKGIPEGLTNLPIVIMVEKGQILSSIKGLAEKDYYIDEFKEYGFIR